MDEIKLVALVLCKGELFFNCSNGINIHSIYPCSKREAHMLSLLLNLELIEQ